jgi:type I restriction enzyme M protein
VSDAWVDYNKTKVGYEVPLNRHFYHYQPPRSLEAIENDIKGLETQILGMLKEVTA